MATEPETPIVTVFTTADEGLLPLATLALDQAGIEYTVRKVGLSEVFGVSHPTPGFESTGLSVQVQVLEDDAARAREVLAELEQAAPVAAAAAAADDDGEPEGPEPSGTTTSGQVKLYEGETGLLVGTLSKDEFEWLSSRLVLESPDDRDYWVDAATIDMLEEGGADTGLLQALRRALGTREGVNVRWR